jgi:hypothetical protein
VGVDTGRFSEPEAFRLPAGLSQPRLTGRRNLLHHLDTLLRDLRDDPALDAMDRHGRSAVEMITGRATRDAFDLELESPAVRERYGNHLWCREVLPAWRLAEAVGAFVTVDLSYHPASGTWDTQCDNIPPYGGISKGLKPLLPLFDHLITTLVSNLEERGMLDDVLVVAQGEFGRTPMMGTQGSTDGRNHCTEIMSMYLAGGGLRADRSSGPANATAGRSAIDPSPRPTSRRRSIDT